MLVEMQYRGDVFRQRRQARDWTVATFLRDPDQGLASTWQPIPAPTRPRSRALAGLLDLALDGWRERRLARTISTAAGRRQGARFAAVDRRPGRGAGGQGRRRMERVPRPDQARLRRSMSSRRARFRTRSNDWRAGRVRGAASGAGLLTRHSNSVQSASACARRRTQKQGDLLHGLR